MNKLKLERIYTKPFDLKGYRIFVDRLWCRGIHKDEAKVDKWAKKFAPSNELRKYYKHVTVKFPDFKRRYIDELASNINVDDFVKFVQEKLKHEDVILLYGSKDTRHNNAVVLKEFIDKKLGLKSQSNPEDFVSYLYNDGITNRRHRLQPVVNYLKVHHNVAKDLGLTYKNSHVFKNGKRLMHQQVLVMAIKYQKTHKNY